MSQQVAQPMSRIDARVPLHVRDRIDYAASLQGRTRTDFLVSAALEKADMIIENENIIRLNRQEQLRLAHALAGESTLELSDFVQQVAKEYRERVSRS